jgi:hypothetical protein
MWNLVAYGWHAQLDTRDNSNLKSCMILKVGDSLVFRPKIMRFRLIKQVVPAKGGRMTIVDIGLDVRYPIFLIYA